MQVLTWEFDVGVGGWLAYTNFVGVSLDSSGSVAKIWGFVCSSEFGWLVKNSVFGSLKLARRWRRVGSWL